MRKIYFFLLIIPFITACHSLSIQKSEKTLEKFQKTIDNSYFQSQADWFYIKGEQKSTQGFYHQAIDSFKQALIYHPNSFSMHFRLIDEYLQAGLYLQAFKQCNTLLIQQPDNIKLHLKMGRIYEQNQLYKKALVEYNWVLEKNVYHIEALYQKAVLHIKKKEFSLARPALITLSQIGEDNLHKIHYLLAQVSKKENQMQKALFYFKKAIDFQPDFLPPTLGLFSFYHKSGQINKAIHILEEFQKNAGFSPQISLVLFHFHHQQKNWDKAIKYLQSFSEANPDNWLIQIQLARIWSQKAEYGKAIAIIKNILSVYPRVSSQVYTLYASFFEQQRDFSKALDVLLKASRIFPADTEVLFYKGFVYDQLGQTDQAIKLMKTVLKIDTNHVNALNYLAFVYAELNKNLESAEQMATRALSFSPNDSYILDTAGWVLFKRGKTEEALKHLERAYQSNTAEGLIAEHLAEVYYHLNMIDKSIALYKKAIGLETNEHRRKKLEKKLLSIQLDV